MTEEKTALSGIVINGRFKIFQQIGKGSFGLVFQGVDTKNNDRPVALKMEQIQPDRNCFLDKEFKMYKALADGPGIPEVFWFGTYKCDLVHYQVLAMELLGRSLEKLMSECSGTFRLRTVLMLADQILQILEFVHGKSIAHRDIKPGNFVLGTGANQNKVYIIDFGLAYYYKVHDSKDSKLKHIVNTRAHQIEAAEKITGSLRFCSLRAHLGHNLSRRDDIESLGYTLVYLLNGTLPWVKCKGLCLSATIKKVYEVKLKYEIFNVLLPNEISEFLSMGRVLAFEEAPNYLEWRHRFKDSLMQLNLPEPVFDWNDVNYWEEEVGTVSVLITSSSSESNINIRV